jgi:hypothetical protein
LIGGWNLFNVSLGIKNFILNFIGRQIILSSHWFMKDGRAIDWRERFPQLPLDKGNKLKEGSWEVWVRGIFFICVFFGRRGECVCERRTTKEHGRNLCVASSYSGVHK